MALWFMLVEDEVRNERRSRSPHEREVYADEMCVHLDAPDIGLVDSDIEVEFKWRDVYRLFDDVLDVDPVFLEDPDDAWCDDLWAAWEKR